MKKDLEFLSISEEEKILINKINTFLPPLENKIDEFMFLKNRNNYFKNLKSVFLFDKRDNYPILNYKNLLTEINDELNILNIYKNTDLKFNSFNNNSEKENKKFWILDYSLNNIEKYFNSHLKIDYLEILNKIYNSENSSNEDELLKYEKHLDDLFNKINDLNNTNEFVNLFSNKKDIELLLKVNQNNIHNKKAKKIDNKKERILFILLSLTTIIIFLGVIICMIVT